MFSRSTFEVSSFMLYGGGVLLEPSVSQVITITRFVHYIKLNLQSGALPGVDGRNKIKTSQGCGIVPPFTDLHQMFFRPINGKTPFT